ncbi:MAG: HypC/HybG/HupF family hydrogenase formation chaperone [Anaerolineales bacterium]|nr:MAG: HypC/HybG/HupF family hydrogenase formation chaperone [Anaerolineales bacterium]
MCLAIPGRIAEISEPDTLLRMGQVDFGGVKREVCLAYVPVAKVGDYVIVHIGFAISQVDETEVHERLALMVESGILGPAFDESAPVARPTE